MVLSLNVWSYKCKCIEWFYSWMFGGINVNVENGFILECKEGIFFSFSSGNYPVSCHVFLDQSCQIYFFKIYLEFVFYSQIHHSFTFLPYFPYTTLIFRLIWKFSSIFETWSTLKCHNALDHTFTLLTWLYLFVDFYILEYLLIDFGVKSYIKPLTIKMENKHFFSRVFSCRFPDIDCMIVLREESVYNCWMYSTRRVVIVLMRISN